MMQDDLHMVNQTGDDLLDGWLKHQRVTCSLSIVFGRCISQLCPINPIYIVYMSHLYPFIRFYLPDSQILLD